MKKIIALVLALMMVLPMMMFTASADTITPDTSWYDASKTEFTITTVEQLYGLASLSANNSFAGKTIKLGADITVNEGDASKWASQAPAYVWSPIRSFAGTFDGQGHTVSGLYASVTSNVAMFTGTNVNCVIKDFNLVNTYFATSSMSCAGVSAGGGGTFQYIYCDAIISCGDHHAGGIFGCSSSKTVAEYCWFDGSVTIAKRYAAGIIGNGNNQTVEIRHCLNTGTIHTTHEGGNAHIAGMCGRNDARTVIEDCLNLGTISSPLTMGGQGDQLGSIFGQCSANNQTEDKTAWISHTTILNSWGSLESAYQAHAALSSKDPSQVHDANVITEKLLKGYGGYLNTTLDFEKTWCVDLEGYPRLQYFSDPETIPPLYDVNQPTISEPELKLEGHYGPRWTLTLELPEGMTRDDVTVGALIIPTAAIPAGHDLNLLDTSFEFAGNDYEVANVEAKIFRESEANKIVATFVVTDLSAQNAFSSFTAVPYVVYTVDGGATLELYGAPTAMQFYQEAALAYEEADEALKAQIDAVLAPMDKELGGRFPITREWMGAEQFTQIPAMIVEGATIVPPTDYGAGNYVVTIDGTNDSDYYAYLEVLEKFGFEKVYDNGEKGIEDVVYNTTFKKGDLTVAVVDMCYTNKVYVSASFEQNLSDHLYDNGYSEDVKPDTPVMMHVNEMYNWGNSILFRLSNGHFIMNDGATDDELPYLLDYLETLVPEGEIPVIEAWFISHMHYDHDCALRAFTKYEGAPDRVIVDGIYVSEPSDVVKDMDKGVYTEIAGVRQGVNLLKDQNGETPKWYRLQSGQRLYFSGLTVEVLLAQEQIPAETYKGGFNDSSTWLRYNIGDQDVLIAGDSHQAGMDLMMKSYDPEMLDFDVFFSLHHGSNTWNTFTEYCTFTTIIHPSTGLPGGGKEGNANTIMGDKAVANGGEVLVEGGGTLVLTFPYKVGTSVKLEGKKWEYHGGTRKQ